MIYRQTYLPNREKRALGLLFHPELYPSLIKRSIDDIRILIWENNSLGDYTTWTIFEEKGNYFARRIRWVQRTDRLSDPETYGFELQISNSIYKYFEEKLETFNLKFQDDSVLIDGIWYGISYKGENARWCSCSSNISTEIIEGYQMLRDELTRIGL